MDHRVLVSHMDGARERHQQPCRGSLGERGSMEELVQTFSVDEFASKERTAILLAYLVDLNDIGMQQRSHRLRFGAKSGKPLLVAELGLSHSLERDDPPQADLPRLVNDAHSSLAN